MGFFKDKRLIIHPGFPKTGTTSLQQNLFARHPDLCNLGRPYENPNHDDPESPLPSIHSLIKSIKFNDKINFDQETADQKLQEYISECPEPEASHVLSDENFLSYWDVTDHGLIAERLKNLFHEAQVVFVIRNQYEMIRSRYVTWLKGVPLKRKRKSFEEWLKHGMEKWKLGYQSHLTVLDFHSHISFYSRLFGRENTHVLLFEDLKDNPEDYFRTWSDLLGLQHDEVQSLMIDSTDKNQRASTLQVLYRRIRYKFPTSFQLGQVLPGKLRSYLKSTLSAGSAYQPDLGPDWKENLQRVIGASNKNLSDTFDLNLGDYDYPNT